jgi:hypothetical protein
MQTTLTDGADIPTVLPDIEADEDRENLLLENHSDELEDEFNTDDLASETPSKRNGSRTGKILKSIVVFTVFLFLMGVAITWFFGMGWFAAQKPHVVNRAGQKDATSAPMTEDEKLKAALTMVASKTPDPNRDSVANRPDDAVTVDKPEINAGQAGDILTMTSSRTSTEPPITRIGASANSQERVIRKDESSNARDKDDGPSVNSSQLSESKTSTEPLGRSLFFGISKAKNEMIPALGTRSAEISSLPKKLKTTGQIPFGTLLPIRLVGAIYTLRNSGGVVRMELTQPIEGKGYSYPAGTTLIGNLRGGESTRAFVSVVGLIDPASGELVKFTGELMGADGASGINGNRKRITGKWTRFFRGLKDTAGSIMGSVGSFRSGGTVILSEPLRRGSEKLSEDTSQSMFGAEREDTFLEITAGTSGYVLVTQLPETGTANVAAIGTGAEKQ